MLSPNDQVTLPHCAGLQQMHLSGFYKTDQWSPQLQNNLCLVKL